MCMPINACFLTLLKPSIPSVMSRIRASDQCKSYLPFLLHRRNFLQVLHNTAVCCSVCLLPFSARRFNIAGVARSRELPTAYRYAICDPKACLCVSFLSQLTFATFTNVECNEYSLWTHTQVAKLIFGRRLLFLSLIYSILIFEIDAL